jgi:hypothetical protein
MESSKYEDTRVLFEQWISSAPYFGQIDRRLNDRLVVSGQYQDLNVQLAWQAWQQALSAMVGMTTVSVPELPAPSGVCASANGHVFMFGGDSNEKCPDGLLCMCGKVRARWTRCPLCGLDRFASVPVDGQPEKEQP